MEHTPGKPDNPHDRIVQHGSAKTGGLDIAVLADNRTDAPQVEAVGRVPFLTEHHAGICGVIGNRIEDLALLRRYGVGALNAGIQDLQGWDNGLGRRQHVLARHIAVERCLHHESDLQFHAWLNEAPGGHPVTRCKQHVIIENPGIGRRDPQGILHDLRGQPNLPTDDPAPGPQLVGDLSRLNGVGLIQRDARMANRKQADLLQRAFRIQQVGSRGFDILGGHASSSTPFFRMPMPSASTSMTSPGFSQIGGSKRAPAPVGVPQTITSPGTSIQKVEM